MKVILLIDFGSTFTKVTAVDLENEIILGCASSFTTVNSDINEGLNNTIEKQTIFTISILSCVIMCLLQSEHIIIFV